MRFDRQSRKGLSGRGNWSSDCFSLGFRPLASSFLSVFQLSFFWLCSKFLRSGEFLQGQFFPFVPQPMRFFDAGVGVVAGSVSHFACRLGEAPS